MFAARLRAYLPDGDSLGLLPDPLSWQLSVVHGDLGALTVSYSTLGAGGPVIARPLADGLEVAVEIWDGATWVEPRGCRFVRVGQGADTADDMEVYSITFRAYGWLLTQAPLIDGTFTDGRRFFVAPTAGSILATILAENAADDGVPITLVGDATNDAAAAPWPTLADQNFEYGANHLGIVRGLQEAGALDWTTQNRGLYAYLPDSTTLSPDLSGSVRLRLGRDIGQAPADETIEGLLAGVAVRAQAGGTVVVDEPTAPVPWGKWRRLLSLGQVDNQAAAEAMGQAELDRSGRVRQQYTRDLVLHDKAPIPLIDYWPGCWITAPTSVAAESVRVQQVTLTWGPDGFGGNVVLNDRLVESDIRRARTLSTLAGGQIGSGGAPAPISVDPEASRIPSTPTGLDVVAALTFTGPTPRGVVTASWDAVTTGTDTGALTISGYELQWRANSGAWQTIVTPELSAQITDLTPGDDIDARVRAVGARTTLPSAWSAIDSVTVPGDVTPPDVPSTPTVTSAFRVASVTWDGLPAMAPDFARVEIALGTTTTPTDVVGTLTRAGTLQVPDQVMGATVYARLRSVDTSGNTSDWSAASAPVVIVGVTGPDLEADSVTANAVAAGAIDGMLITGPTIRTAASGARLELSGTTLQSITATETVALEVTPTRLRIFDGGQIGTVHPSTIFGTFLGPIYGVDGVTVVGRGILVEDIDGQDLMRVRSGTVAGDATVQLFSRGAEPSGMLHYGPGDLVFDGQGSASTALRTQGTGDCIIHAQAGGQVVMVADSGDVTVGSVVGQLTVAADNGDVTIGAGTSGHNVYVHTHSAGPADGVIQLKFSGTSGGNTRAVEFSDQAAVIARVRSDGLYLYTYGATDAGDLVLGSGGRVNVVVSSRRYKQDIEPHTVDANAFLNLQPVSYRSTSEVAENPATTSRYVGFIAEDVHDAGLTEFVYYQPDGTVEGLRYKQMVIALKQIAKEEREIRKDLQARLDALDGGGALQAMRKSAADVEGSGSGDVISIPRPPGPASRVPARPATTRTVRDVATEAAAKIPPTPQEDPHAPDA